LLYKLNKRYDHVTSKVNPEVSPTPLIKLKKELLHDSVELDMADSNVEYMNQKELYLIKLAELKNNRDNYEQDNEVDDVYVSIQYPEFIKEANWLENT